MKQPSNIPFAAEPKTDSTLYLWVHDRITCIRSFKIQNTYEKKNYATYQSYSDKSISSSSSSTPNPKGGDGGGSGGGDIDGCGGCWNEGNWEILLLSPAYKGLGNVVDSSCPNGGSVCPQ